MLSAISSPNAGRIRWLMTLAPMRSPFQSRKNPPGSQRNEHRWGDDVGADEVALHAPPADETFRLPGQVRSAILWRLWARAISPTQVCAPARVRKRVRRRPLRFSCEIRPSSPLRNR
jgi:hypothetical protein